jgi:hypothetical protein
VGSVAFALDLGSVANIDFVGYEISGNAFDRTGTIDVSKSTTASTLVDSVPFGSGYIATMTASSTGAPRIDCSGTASFDVTGAGVTSVPVHVICKEAPVLAPPPAVPVPPGAVFAVSLLLLGAGLGLIGRAARKETAVSP